MKWYYWLSLNLAYWWSFYLIYVMSHLWSDTQYKWNSINTNFAMYLREIYFYSNSISSANLKKTYIFMIAEMISNTCKMIYSKRKKVHLQGRFWTNKTIQLILLNEVVFNAKVRWRMKYQICSAMQEMVHIKDTFVLSY